MTKENESNLPNESEIQKRQESFLSYLRDGLFVLAPGPGKVIPKIKLTRASEICQKAGFTTERTNDGLLVRSTSDKTDLIECFLDAEGRVVSASFRLSSMEHSVYFRPRSYEYDYENDRLVEERLYNEDETGLVRLDKIVQYIYLTEEGDDLSYIVMEKDDDGTRFSRSGI